MILGMSKSIHQIPAANLAAVKPIPNIKGSNHINNLSRRRRHWSAEWSSIITTWIWYSAHGAEAFKPAIRRLVFFHHSVRLSILFGSANLVGYNGATSSYRIFFNLKCINGTCYNSWNWWTICCFLYNVHGIVGAGWLADWLVIFPSPTLQFDFITGNNTSVPMYRYYRQSNQWADTEERKTTTKVDETRLGN